MTRPTAALAILITTPLLLTACGGDSATVDLTTPTGDDIGAGPTTAAAAPATAAAGGSGDTAPAGAEATAGGEQVVVTIDGIEYRLGAGDDIAVGATGSTFPARCEPDAFGAGMFWVIATAVGADGVRAEPNVNLTLNLPHDGAGTADMPPEFELFAAASGDSPLQLDYVLATEDALAGVGGPAFDGDLGSWTVDGNRIAGEVTVFEGDHVREFFTATFDISCPDG